MSEHRDSTFQVRMTAEELALAKQRASQQGVTLSSVVRGFIRRFIADPEVALEDIEPDTGHAEYDHAHAKSKRTR